MTLRRSENEFVGVGSGLLDQFSSLFGRADHALFLDCGTLVHDRLPLGDPAPAIVVCDSRTSRRLADGMYDQRRAECERVVAAFRDRIPHRGEFRLSWVSLEQLEAEWDDLDPVGRKRARHVLTENERVRQGVEALKSGDIVAFGRLMSASHASSRDDFENSSPRARCPDRGSRSRSRLPRRQALRCRLGRLHGQPGPCRPRRRLRRSRPDGIRPGDRHHARDPHLPCRRWSVRAGSRSGRSLNVNDRS